MESLRKQRSISRRFYTLAERDLEDAFEEGSSKNVHAMYKIAKQKAEELFSVDDQIKELWFRDTEANEETIFADLQTAESYNSRWTIVSTKYCRNYAVDADAMPYDAATVRLQSHKSNAGSVKSLQRRFVLPKIELRKFDGDINNWIAFWGQFSKIHNDPDIDDGDKFQYLVQATEPGSKARELVESFPPYAKNYKKTILQRG